MKKLRVAVVGCGSISGIYLKNLTGLFSPLIDVKMCCDINTEAAKRRAEEYNIANVSTVEDMLSNSNIECVLNLTNPWVHYEITMKALQAGKHVYNEKPLALSRKEAQEMNELADKKGLRIGCAPDTFLGAGLQTCRKLIDEGWIGRPVGANAIITMGGGSQRYNSKRIGGALLDMAPYYITALTTLLGSAKKVTGLAVSPIKSKKVCDLCKPDFGEEYNIEIMTNLMGIIEYENNVLANITSVTDGEGYWPRLEVFGTEGIMKCNDPNFFGSPAVEIKRRGGDFKEMPLTHQFCENSRGLGLAEMAAAILNKEEHRASGKLAFHVLDILLSLLESSTEGNTKVIGSSIQRPKPFICGHNVNVFEI